MRVACLQRLILSPLLTEASSFVELEHCVNSRHHIDMDFIFPRWDSESITLKGSWWWVCQRFASYVCSEQHAAHMDQTCTSTTEQAATLSLCTTTRIRSAQKTWAAALKGPLTEPLRNAPPHISASSLAGKISGEDVENQSLPQPLWQAEIADMYALIVECDRGLSRRSCTLSSSPNQLLSPHITPESLIIYLVCRTALQMCILQTLHAAVTKSWRSSDYSDCARIVISGNGNKDVCTKSGVSAWICVTNHTRILFQHF